FETGVFINDDGRMSRPGDDGPLAGGQGSAGDGGAAGDDEQGDAAMIEDRFGGFERWRNDAGDEIVDAEFRGDGFVIFAHGVGGALGAGRMRVGGNRVRGGG